VNIESRRAFVLRVAEEISTGPFRVWIFRFAKAKGLADSLGHVIPRLLPEVAEAWIGERLPVQSLYRLADFAWAIVLSAEAERAWTPEDGLEIRSRIALALAERDILSPAQAADEMARHDPLPIAEPCVLERTTEESRTQRLAALWGRLETFEPAGWPRHVELSQPTGGSR
jgi:hypothetical protein